MIGNPTRQSALPADRVPGAVIPPTHTVLVTAYALHPERGSEDGTGWNLLLQIAKHNYIYVFTRWNNLPDIEAYVAGQTDPGRKALLARIVFLGYDLPRWARWWKKGARGSTLYFWLWQWGVAREAKRTSQRLGIRFDLAHALNFHSDSHPQFLHRLGIPVIWGPLGHHDPVPRAYLFREGLTRQALLAFVRDRANALVKHCVRRFDPWYRSSVRRASLILATHPGVPSVMDACSRPTLCFPAVGAADPASAAAAPKDGFVVFSAGRLVPMKGFGTALRAFAGFYHQLTPAEQDGVRFCIAGTGPEEHPLRALAEQLKVADAVDFLGWVTPSTMPALFANAAVFLFPSHEGAGMVVPEAMAQGLPVLCFDNAGPGFLAGANSALRIPVLAPEQAEQRFAQGLLRLLREPAFREEQSREARQRFNQMFHWEAKGEQLRAAYTQLFEQTFIPGAGATAVSNLTETPLDAQPQLR